MGGGGLGVICFLFYVAVCFGRVLNLKLQRSARRMSLLVLLLLTITVLPGLTVSDYHFHIFKPFIKLDVSERHECPRREY